MQLKAFLTILATAAIFTACQQSGQKTADTASADSTAANVSGNLSGEFYDSLNRAMKSYFELSGALVKADTQSADMAAAVLKAHLESLPFQRSGADSTRQSILSAATGDITAELDGMLMQKGGLDARRTAFKAVSDMLYDVIQSAGLKSTTVYRQYCPMAFNDRGAHWLSDKQEILNPYFGDEMLHCGTVTDTLHFQ